MDRVSATLTVLLVLWGLLGIVVGSRTLKRQREVGEEAQRRAYLANLGASRLQQAQAFIQEYAPLLDRPDVDKVVFERVLREGYGFLNVIVDEASAASEDLGNNSLANIQNFLSASYMLKDFVEHELEVWHQRFETVESESVSDASEGEETPTEPQPEELFREASTKLRKADRTVQAVRRRVATAAT